MGFTQTGKSPRGWRFDHGWWLINVEFQPSNFSVGSYLNVGLQHLWVVRDWGSFSYGSRTMIEGHGHFVDLVDEEVIVQERANAIAISAAAAAQPWLRMLDGDVKHLRWLTKQDGGGWDELDAGIASALLGKGRAARDTLLRLRDRLDQAIEWQRDLSVDCNSLVELTHRPVEFRAHVLDRVAQTRLLQKLPEWDPATFSA